MNRVFRISAVHALGLAFVLSAAACKKADDNTATIDTGTAGGTVAPNTTTPGAAALRVTDVDLGKRVGTDNAIADETDDFGTRDTIVAVVKTEGTPAAGATLVARWTFQDGQVVQEQTENVAAPAAGGTESRTVFRLTKATAWPTGKYTLRVLHNGTEVQSKDFEVK